MSDRYAQTGAATGDVIGALIAEAMNQGDYERASQLRQQQLENLDQIKTPSSFEKMGPSAFGNIQLDPRTQAARMQALQRLQEIGNEGGMDAQSRAALQEANDEVAGQRRGLLGEQQQAMAARGMGGSNLEAASALQAADTGSNAQAKFGAQAAAGARQRALAALSGSADLAGDIQRDQYGRERDKAMASDAISRFNAGMANQFGQQQFENQMGLENARNNAIEGERSDLEEQDQRRRGYYRGVGKGTGAVLGAGGDDMEKYLTYGLSDVGSKGSGGLGSS